MPARRGGRKVAAPISEAISTEDLELLDGLVFEESAAPDFSTLADEPAVKPAPKGFSVFGGGELTAITAAAPSIGSIIKAPELGKPRLTIEAGAITRTGRPNVGQSVRVGVLKTAGAEPWQQAAIILKVHDPLPGKTGWPCDLAVLCKWHTSPAPTAVKGLSGTVIGHLDAPTGGPPTGTTVMMTFSEKVDDANGTSGYGWRYVE